MAVQQKMAVIQCRCRRCGLVTEIEYGATEDRAIKALVALKQDDVLIVGVNLRQLHIDCDFAGLRGVGIVDLIGFKLVDA